MSNKRYFEINDELEEEIRALSDRLYDICREHNLPMIFAVQTAAKPGTDDLMISCVMRPKENQTKLLNASPVLLASSAFLDQNAIHHPDLMFILRNFNEVRRKEYPDE